MTIHNNKLMIKFCSFIDTLIVNLFSYYCHAFHKLLMYYEQECDAVLQVPIQVKIQFNFHEQFGSWSVHTRSHFCALQPILSNKSLLLPGTTSP